MLEGFLVIKTVWLFGLKRGSNNSSQVYLTRLTLFAFSLDDDGHNARDAEVVMSC